MIPRFADVFHCQVKCQNIANCYAQQYLTEPSLKQKFTAHVDSDTISYWCFEI